MSKNNSNNNTYDEEDYQDIREDNNEYNYNDSLKTSESIDNKLNAEDFDTERVLYDIKKTMNGFDKRDGTWVRVTYPMARSEFINNYINSIRSLVNFTNMFSITTSEESALDMLESLKEIIFYCVDSGIKEEHIETLVNIYDTLKSKFYGIIIDGRGTENIKQVLTSVYKDIRDIRTTNIQSPINWDYINKKIRN